MGWFMYPEGRCFSGGIAGMNDNDHADIIARVHVMLWGLTSTMLEYFMDSSYVDCIWNNTHTMGGKEANSDLVLLIYKP